MNECFMYPEYSIFHYPFFYSKNTYDVSSMYLVIGAKDT